MYIHQQLYMVTEQGGENAHTKNAQNIVGLITEFKKHTGDRHNKHTLWVSKQTDADRHSRQQRGVPRPHQPHLRLVVGAAVHRGDGGVGQV